MPIKVPLGEFCWDDKRTCEHFDNEGGHARCTLGFFNWSPKMDGHGWVVKPADCLHLKEG